MTRLRIEAAVIHPAPDNPVRSHAGRARRRPRLFLEGGCSTTTLAAIADAADVTMETIHKAFGGKRGLVRAIWQ